MLKTWMVNDGRTDSILVEGKFHKWVEQLRSDKYVTATLAHMVAVSVLNKCSCLSCSGDQASALQNVRSQQRGQKVCGGASQGLLGL